ncbi:MAG: glycosyltransferase family 4 protein [Bacteroidaceae bacterium]|nr:glycosyltransferase family 4 protein [Bacteroidaceae bacterium]
MKILFLIYHGFSEHSGISKKIHYQIKGLRENGHEVHVCTYYIREDGHRVRMIDDDIVLQDFGSGRWAAMKQRFSFRKLTDYVIENGFEFVYARSFHNANPATVRMFKRFKAHGIPSVMEIPTYPYDQEYAGTTSLENKIKLMLDKLYRKKLAAQMEAIVTFTNDKEIFGQRTICISNGIDYDHIPIQQKLPHPDNEVHLIGVAEVHYWHGYDRLIAGLGEYYQKPHDKEVYFHIVGGVADSEMYGSEHAKGFHELIQKYGIEKYVIFHGPKFGNELDELFNQADFAIGSLGRHRSGITHIKTLKNREYAARGIPFVYSETDEDFEQMPYVIKIAADDSPINVQVILAYIRSSIVNSIDIRISINSLSWNEQMRKVMDYIYCR